MLKSYIPFSLLITLFPIPALAQIYWGIGEGAEITPCGNVPITIFPNASGLFSAPYTMNAYPSLPLSPTFTQLTDSLEWVVPHAAPIGLMLQLSDANRKSMGVLPQTYEVTGFGGTTTCIPTSPCPSFLMFSSTTGPNTLELEICDKLFLNFTGNAAGKPYTVTIITMGTDGGFGNVSNYAMGKGDNQLVWVDRESVVQSGGNVVAYATDSFGAYGPTTGFLPLDFVSSRTDTTCPNSGPTLSSDVISTLPGDGIVCVSGSSNGNTSVQFGGGSNTSSSVSPSLGGGGGSSTTSPRFPSSPVSGTSPPAPTSSTSSTSSGKIITLLHGLAMIGVPWIIVSQ